jgi:2-dehydro-3-deoxyphosphogluconate aldolase/(4S)-4-hydroxy-2-oxoglutarate aldolase
MSSAAQSTINLVETSGVVAIIRLKDPGQVRDVALALMAGGVCALEITMTVPGAVDLIRQIAPTVPAGFRLGAGTVVDGPTATRCIDAGAAFIVSPVLRRDVLAACRDRGVPSMPGCFSPTEILEAWDEGADIVKVFPATSLGPGYIKDLRGPLPHLKLMPTGGVSVENAGDWIRAGAIAVGVGSALIDPAALAARDYDAIADRARRLVAGVAAAKGSC